MVPKIPSLWLSCVVDTLLIPICLILFGVAKNRVEALKLENGELCHDQQESENYAIIFYKELYRVTNLPTLDRLQNGGFPCFNQPKLLHFLLIWLRLIFLKR